MLSPCKVGEMATQAVISVSDAEGERCYGTMSIVLAFKALPEVMDKVCGLGRIVCIRKRGKNL